MCEFRDDCKGYEVEYCEDLRYGLPSCFRGSFTTKTTDEAKLQCSDWLSALRECQQKMTDNERLDLWDKVMADYCQYCGSEHLPCYCTDDA